MNGTVKTLPKMDTQVEAAEPQVESLPIPMPRERGVMSGVRDTIVIALFRLGLGPMLKLASSTMIMRCVGEDEESKKYTPVKFVRFAGNLYSLAECGRETQWYQYIQMTRDVELWLGNAHWRGSTEIVSDLEEARYPWRKLVLMSGLKQGPMPKTSSTELEAMIRERMPTLPLVRVHLEERLRGVDDPGNLVWIWAVVAGITGVMVGIYWFTHKLVAGSGPATEAVDKMSGWYSRALGRISISAEVPEV
jgi:hypothetical protein